MASWEEVRRIALSCPGAAEGTTYGQAAWKVKDKLFVWERPLGKADRAQLGAAAPEGPVLAARVPDEGAKQALIADDPEVYFTIPHFDGYPAILIRLDRIPSDELSEVVDEAWACRAPAKLVAQRHASGDGG